MNRSKNRRIRLGSLLAMALGAVALLAMPGIAAAKDRNHDHIPDRWEKCHNFSLSVNQAGRDQEGDHLRNLGEFKAGDNPRNADSDNDGVMDGEENAGTIASFDAASGKLVINLFNADTVSGLVTTETEIKCEGVDNSSSSASTSSGEPEPGDDNGGQGEEPGDDNGGNGEEQGDDNGGSDNSGPGSSNSGPGSHGDNGEAANCTTADLIPGAVVQQAELEIQNGAATFHEVELGHTS
ncbi:MAG: peptidase papain [Solirubrobacterales bacterium]|nr:peptidase papain [Solirubrobacterales bacterium]